MPFKPIFTRINNVRVIPVSMKIIVIFALFILISNFASNHINLMYNRSHQIRMIKQLLVKELKDIYHFSNIQHEILEYTGDRDGLLRNIEKKGIHEFERPGSLLLGVRPNGNIDIAASYPAIKSYSISKKYITSMNTKLLKGIEEDFLTVFMGEIQYFGIYKYNPKWDLFFYRAEAYDAFFRESKNIFNTVSLIILCISMVSTLVGIFVLRYLLRFIGHMTDAIMNMVKKQELQIIPLQEATNDDIAYLGTAFNALSDSTMKLLSIFKKFTDQDIVEKAYIDKEIKLEGDAKELTILFSDIQDFTNITEILGTDIINLLNLYFENMIRRIMSHDGTISAIIGDALLASFGTVPLKAHANKSLAALTTAFELQKVVADLRQEINDRKELLVKKQGTLKPDEAQLYNAVLVEIGIGIDGGRVFYGTVGSNLRMTNTVLGDNVNTASRLEGLTRLYKVPIICSEYVKKDIEANNLSTGIDFIELDRIKVKGKDQSTKIFWPVHPNYQALDMESCDKFSEALKHYYAGDWEVACKIFCECPLEPSELFVRRIEDKTSPEDWNGVWTMTKK